MNDSKELWLKVKEQIDQLQVCLGVPYSQDYLHDPKHVCFALARYKFAGRMLERFGKVIEVGCGCATASPIIAQFVGKIVCTDIDERQLEENRLRLLEFHNMVFEYHDFRVSKYPDPADGIVFLDVLEHIFPDEEPAFMRNVTASLTPNGVAVIGTPNAKAAAHASAASRLGHVNLKYGDGLRDLCSRYFHRVFMFGMNDEVVHTGFLPMAHYLLALCVCPREYGMDKSPERA